MPKPQRLPNGQIARVPVIERFWSKVDMSGGENACWPWNGPRRPNGYGFTTDYWKKILAHRLAYELTFGPIPPRLLVCHRCDNPPCVNPAHLFLGTYSDNAKDMVAKGRGVTGPTNPARGEAVATAKLTEADVRAIREAYEPGPKGYPAGVRWHKPTRVSLRALAKEYNVSASLIQAIVTRKVWAHVD